MRNDDLASLKHSRLVKAWRRTHTFGGYVWPSPQALRGEFRGDPTMTGEEVLDELEWLLDGGESLDHAAATLERTHEALSKLAYRHGRAELGRRIDAERNRDYRKQAA